MTYEEAEQAYRDAAMKLIASREAYREADETVQVVRYMTWGLDEVQEGHNAEVRRAKLEKYLMDHEGYQDQRLEVLRLRRSVDEAEVEERITRKRMDWLIATGGEPK